MKTLRHFVGGFVGIFLLVNSVFAQDILISSPTNGESVDPRYNITGEVSDPNSDVIVVIHPISGSDFWVQPPVTVLNDGQWRVMGYFGSMGMDHGQEYEVRAFANPSSRVREGRYDSWPSAEARSNVVRVRRR